MWICLCVRRASILGRATSQCKGLEVGVGVDPLSREDGGEKRVVRDEV